MKVVKIQYEKPLKMKFNLEETNTWIMGMIGMVSGCLAFIKGIPFIDVSWTGIFENALGALWALFVATLTAVGGMLGKHIYDAKLKSRVNKWLKKKKKGGSSP